MSGFFRGATIIWVVLRYGLDELVLSSFEHPWLRLLARLVSVGRDLSAPRGQRLREALERLGPIFVKFGQVLSTRRDLMPPDIADELRIMSDKDRNISHGVVTSAVALNESLLAKVQATLEKLTGTKVLLETRVDPAIIGGIVAKVGDLVLDGSIKTQLNGLKESIKGRE